MKKRNWKKYIFEFLSIFIAVISAFALDNWNDNRRDRNTEHSILIEISNGFDKDLEDIKINVDGHEDGIRACKYWRKLLNTGLANQDSVARFYLSLTRDYTSVQNTSGYESLKSKGLEIIKNDSLRFKIISLYEYDYYTLKKFEEEYSEMQFHDSYYKEINYFLAPYFIFDEKGNIQGINTPLVLTGADKKIALTYLWKIQLNRAFTMRFYSDVEEKINKLKNEIEVYIEK